MDEINLLNQSISYLQSYKDVVKADLVKSNNPKTGFLLKATIDEIDECILHLNKILSNGYQIKEFN